MTSRSQDRWETKPAAMALVVFLVSALLFGSHLALRAQEGSHTTGFTVQQVVHAELDVAESLISLPETGAMGPVERLGLMIETNAPSLEIGAILEDLPDGVHLELRLVQSREVLLPWQSVNQHPLVLGHPKIDEQGAGDCVLEIRGSITGSPLSTAFSSLLHIEIRAETTTATVDCLLHASAHEPAIELSILAPPKVFVNEPAEYAAQLDPASPCDVVWDFGDGTPSVEGSPQLHAFLAVGEYIVRATATCPRGPVSSEMLVTVVYRPPEAVLNVESEPGGLAHRVGAPIVFSAGESVPGSGEIVHYEWDWSSDGMFVESEISEAMATLTYNQAGIYTVAVRVTDEHGLSDTDAARITVSESPTAPWLLSIVEEDVGGGGEVAHLELDELTITVETVGLQDAVGATGNPSSTQVLFPFDEGDGIFTLGIIRTRSQSSREIRAIAENVGWGRRLHEGEVDTALLLRQTSTVEIPHDPELALGDLSSYRIEFWLRLGDAAQFVPVLQQGHFKTDGIGIHLIGGIPVFGVFGRDSSPSFAIGNKHVDDGVWHHVACVRSAESIQVTVDGEAGAIHAMQAPSTGANDPTGFEQPIVLGWSQTMRPFGGLIHAARTRGQPLLVHASMTAPSEPMPPRLSVRRLANPCVPWSLASTQASSQEDGSFHLLMHTADLAPGVYEVAVASQEDRSPSLGILILPTLDE